MAAGVPEIQKTNGNNSSHTLPVHIKTCNGTLTGHSLMLVGGGDGVPSRPASDHSHMRGFVGNRSVPVNNIEDRSFRNHK
jgi:hypothetical protein